MLLTQTLLLLAAITGPTTGASVPMAPRSEGYILPNLGDGVFAADIGPDNVVNVMRLGDIPAHGSDTTTTSRSLASREIPITGHGCYGQSFNHDDWLRAARGFDNACNRGHKIPKTGILYVTVGNHIAFGCAWGRADQGCSQAEYADAQNHLHVNCGSFTTGYVDMHAWRKQYGMQQRGDPICGKAGDIRWGTN